MPLILAVEPNSRQATYLAAVLRARRGTELVIAGSAKKALAGLNDRIPDVVLTSPLVSPQDETALANWMKELGPAGSRVHSLTIPILAAVPEEPQKKGVLSALRRSKKQQAPADGCEPAMFADQIASYVARSKAEQREAEEVTPVAPVATVEEFEADEPELEAAAAYEPVEAETAPAAAYEPSTPMLTGELEIIEFEPVGEQHPSADPQPAAEVYSSASDVASETEAVEEPERSLPPMVPLPELEPPMAALEAGIDAPAIAALEPIVEQQPDATLEPAAEVPSVVELHAAIDVQGTTDFEPVAELQPVVALHAAVELPTVADEQPIAELHPIVDSGTETVGLDAIAPALSYVDEPMLEETVAPRESAPAPVAAIEWALEPMADVVAPMSVAPMSEPALAADDVLEPVLALSDADLALADDVITTAPPEVTMSGDRSTSLLELVAETVEPPAEAPAVETVALASDAQPWLEVVFENLIEEPRLAAADMVPRPEPANERDGGWEAPTMIVFEEIPSRAGASAVPQAVMQASPKTSSARRGKPAQDEWGLFDPTQCGFAALLDKLDEITTHEEGDADEAPESPATKVRVIGY